MRATNKEAALQELSQIAAQSCDVQQPYILRTLLERELLGSTGVGAGTALPHGKIHGIDRIHLFFARSERGINFDAVDAKPVFLFLLLLSPAHIAEEYLLTLASASKVLKSAHHRHLLRTATKPEEIGHIFATPLTR
jgi:nitrogen PTS system EIIA component